MFSVTCLEKKWVGRSGIFLSVFTFFFLFTTQTTEMHTLAAPMFHQHKCCVYKGKKKKKKKLKLLITCTFCALTDFICFVNIFFRKCGKKCLQSEGFREGGSGYSKHNFCFA